MPIHPSALTDFKIEDCEFDSLIAFFVDHIESSVNKPGKANTKPVYLADVARNFLARLIINGKKWKGDYLDAVAKSINSLTTFKAFFVDKLGITMVTEIGLTAVPAVIENFIYEKHEDKVAQLAKWFESRDSLIKFVSNVREVEKSNVTEVEVEGIFEKLSEDFFVNFAKADPLGYQKYIEKLHIQGALVSYGLKSAFVPRVMSQSLLSGHALIDNSVHTFSKLADEINLTIPSSDTVIIKGVMAYEFKSNDLKVKPLSLGGAGVFGITIKQNADETWGVTEKKFEYIGSPTFTKLVNSRHPAYQFALQKQLLLESLIAKLYPAALANFDQYTQDFDFRNKNLSGAVLANQCLSNAGFENVCFDGTCLHESDLRNLTFKNTNFINAYFSKTKINAKTIVSNAMIIDQNNPEVISGAQTVIYYDEANNNCVEADAVATLLALKVLQSQKYSSRQIDQEMMMRLTASIDQPLLESFGAINKGSERIGFLCAKGLSPDVFRFHLEGAEPLSFYKNNHNNRIMITIPQVLHTSPGMLINEFLISSYALKCLIHSLAFSGGVLKPGEVLESIQVTILDHKKNYPVHLIIYKKDGLNICAQLMGALPNRSCPLSQIAVYQEFITDMLVTEKYQLSKIFNVKSNARLSLGEFLHVNEFKLSQEKYSVTERIAFELIKNFVHSPNFTMQEQALIELFASSDEIELCDTPYEDHAKVMWGQAISFFAKSKQLPVDDPRHEENQALGLQALADAHALEKIVGL